MCGTCRRKYCVACLVANYEQRETDRLMNMKDAWGCFTCEEAELERQARARAAYEVRATASRTASVLQPRSVH